MKDSSTQLTKIRPFRGMLSYQDTLTDEKLFSGRDTEGEALVSSIRSNVLTVFYGHSGTGKTSLLNAFVIPKLRSLGYLPIYIRLSYDEDKDHSHLAEQVKAAIVGNVAWKENCSEPFTDLHLRKSSETLWEYFAKYSATSKTTVPILVFDQFEELFTLGTTVEEEVEQLKTELHYLIENQFPPLSEEKLQQHPELLMANAQKFRVLFSIREDYLPQLNRLKDSIYSIDKAKIGLDDIKVDAVDSIINTIQKEFAVNYFGNESITKLKEYLASLNDQPQRRKDPISITLGLVCYQLNEYRILQNAEAVDPKWLTKKFIEKRIGEYYTTSVSDKKIRKVIEQELINKHGYRLSIPKDLLTQEKKLSEDTIDYLVDERRILRYERRLGNVDVEIVHDSLAQKILQLRREREEKRKTVIFVSSALGAALIILLAIAEADNIRVKAEGFADMRVIEGKMKADSIIGKVRDSMRHVIDTAVKSNQEKLRMQALRESENERKHNEQLKKTLEIQQRDTALLKSRLRATQISYNRKLDSVNRLNFARVLIEKAITDPVNSVAVTYALLAYDTLIHSPYNMEDAIFPGVYEALITSFLDSLTILRRADLSRAQTLYILEGKKENYFWAQASSIPHRIGDKTKLTHSARLRTWIGRTRERQAYLIKTGTFTDAPLFSLVVDTLRGEVRRITIPFEENESIESCKFFDDDNFLLFSTRILGKPGKLYRLDVLNNRRQVIQTPLTNDEYLLLENMEAPVVGGVSNKGRYLIPSDFNSTKISLSSPAPFVRYGHVTALSYRSSSKTFIAGTSNGWLLEISPSGYKEILKDREGIKVSALSMDADGSLLALGTHRGSIRLVNLSNRKNAQLLPSVRFAGTDYSITSMVFSNAGVLLAAREDGTFYHLPLSISYLKNKICSDGLLIPGRDWPRYFNSKVDPRNLCKEID
jgi:hypothetical protein